MRQSEGKGVMPRQQINDTQTFAARVGDDGQVHSQRPVAAGEPLNPVETHRFGPTLELSWRADPGWVQVQVVLDPADVLAMARSIQAEAPGSVAFCVDLNSRAELQTLIRVARRARDSVHGADE